MLGLPHDERVAGVAAEVSWQGHSRVFRIAGAPSTCLSHAKLASACRESARGRNFGRRRI
ncbi:hypothetical protein FNJ47_23930 [Bradyrhizobium sp. UFLA 03-164]|uniref:Uncharacterized protein n=1 Tax=Bradyrhizobium uaiense TaxID=2594946 RepID=A0A6P1BKM5_9BRAD|nr:hypothetical protein [Bradyrhizobium uaiense]